MLIYKVYVFAIFVLDVNNYLKMMKISIIKKGFITFIFMLSVSIQAQRITSCKECAIKKHTKTTIANNKLFELELLRNEIFARHQYIFKNQLLTDYFNQFDWYKPDYKNEVKISLNSNENHNIELFKKRESELKQQRVVLINELESFKKALNTNNQSYIDKVCLSKLTKGDIPYYDYLITTLKRVFSKVPLNNIYWHKGNAQYSIETDNGFSISAEGIYISGNEITIRVSDPQSHSSLMKDDEAFEYPSEYESESENAIFATFIIENKKLVLVKTTVAG